MKKKRLSSSLSWIQKTTDSLRGSKIYDAFQPRPHCVNTVLGMWKIEIKFFEQNFSVDTSKSGEPTNFELQTQPSPISFSMKNSNAVPCLNTIELAYLSIGFTLVLSCFLLIYYARRAGTLCFCGYNSDPEAKKKWFSKNTIFLKITDFHVLHWTSEP